MPHNLEEVKSARQIAEATNVSPRQIERCFSTCLGLSPLTAYRDLRLERAHRLLWQTNLPLAEVAVASGFSSTAQLSKWYRKKYGEAPAASRRRAFGNTQADLTCTAKPPAAGSCKMISA